MLLQVLDLMAQQQSFWSIITGYIYSLTWALSFYGQLYENYQQKSVEGYSYNYFVMNFSGYLLYSLYMSIGYFTTIKGAGTVVLADLLFVYHAMLMMILYSIQFLIYPKGKNRLSFKALAITICVWVIVLTEILLGGILNIIKYNEYWNPLSVMGYAKLTLVLIKCFPQLYWNYRRKSTKGWNIANILFDLIGGVFSFISASLSKQNGLNLSKILLGVFSIVIDLSFAFQHYCLYRKKNTKNQQRESLMTVEHE